MAPVRLVDIKWAGVHHFLQRTQKVYWSTDPTSRLSADSVAKSWSGPRSSQLARPTSPPSADVLPHLGRNLVEILHRDAVLREVQVYKRNSRAGSLCRHNRPRVRWWIQFLPTLGSEASLNRTCFGVFGAPGCGSRYPHVKHLPNMFITIPNVETQNIFHARVL